MERASSQREKGIGLDYLTEFQLASSSLMSGQSPMDQVFQTFTHLPNSTSAQMAFQASQNTYGHPAGQQYTQTPSFMSDRYAGMPYLHPSFLNEDYFAQQCLPSSTHIQGQPYSAALPSSTPPMPPPMQSPQLSPMLRAHSQSPQQATASMMLHSKPATSTRAAPANSPQSTVFNAQLHSPHQHYNSTLGGPPGYYTTSQCSQRNDPPVGNMHMTKILNSQTFNHASQFNTGAHSQLPPSSQSSLRSLNNGSIRPGKDSSSQMKNLQPSNSRPTGRESNLNTLQQSLSSSYLSSLAHSLQPRSSVAGTRGTQGRFQPTMSMAPVRAQSAGSTSSTSFRKQSPSVSSSNKSPMTVNFEASFPRSAFSEMASKVNRDKQLGPSSGMNSLQSNVYGRKKSVKEGSNSVSNPYDVFSIFSLNGQPAREVVRGKPEAATRPLRPEGRSTAVSKEMTPINWYKSPLMASSYSSDIEAMQADIIMESMMPIRASKQTSVKESGSVQRPPKAQGQPPTTKPANSGQLGSSSGSIQQSKTSQQPPLSGQHSISASKSAALAAIRIKQEQAESLVKNRLSRNGNDEAIAAFKATERQSLASSLNASPLNSPHVIGTLPTQTYSTGPEKTKNLDIQKDCAIVNRSAKPSNPILDLSSTPEKKDRSNPTVRDLSNNVRENISSTALNEKSGNKSDNFLEQPNPPQTHFSHANSLSGPPYQLKIGQHAAIGNQQDKKQLSSMKKALDMWKAGQVVGRAPSKSKAKDVSIPSSSMPNKTTAVNSVTNSKHSHVPIEKNTHLESTTKNGSVNADLVPDTVQSDAHQGVRTSQTALQFCYIILHGHKLVCLKSRNDTSVLLCQFLSECFPDKGIGSVHNCIDRALRIKKRYLDNTHATHMGSFLEKNGYTEQMIETISLDDARRVYHYVYKLVCNTTTCIVEVSHEQVDLDSLSMPARSLRLKEMATKIKKELAGSIEKSGLRTAPQSQPTAQITKSPLNFLGSLDSNGEIDTDGHSIGSDHTEVYGKKTDNEDDLIFVEAIQDPNIITLTPGIPKAGGICNTVVGSVRYYQHNNENYLVVEDLCNIFSAPVFYHTVEEESFVLYSCSQEIADFLNSIQGTFPPLSSPQQSLIKEADVGSLIIDDDGDNAGERSGSMKRPICKQEKPDEYESSSKKQKVDRDKTVSNGMSEDEDESSEQPQCESLLEETLVDRGAEETTQLILDQVALELEPLKAAPANKQHSATEENMPSILETVQPMPEARPGIPVEKEITEKSRPRGANYSKYNNLRLRALKMGKMLSKTSANLAKDKGKQVNTVEKLEVVKPSNSSDIIASPDNCSSPESTTQQLEASSETIQEIHRSYAGELDTESFNAPLENAKEVLPSTVKIIPQCQKPYIEKACVDVTAPILVDRQEAEDRAVVEAAISFEVDSSKAGQDSHSGDSSETAQASRSGDSSETAQSSHSGDSSDVAQASHSCVKNSDQSEVVQKACNSSVNKAQSISSATTVSSSSPCLSTKKSFDDLSIITSTSHGSLVACPSSQFCSIKSLCEGYNKLCFQNKSLLQFAHLLRKEMAANKEKAEKEIAAHGEKAEKKIAANKEKTKNEIATNLEKAEKEIAASMEKAEREIAGIKEKAEKEIAANKEKADREIEKLQDIIQQLTSGFKNCDSEAPILIDD